MNITWLHDSAARCTLNRAAHPRETTPATSGSKFKFTRCHVYGRATTTMSEARILRMEVRVYSLPAAGEKFFGVCPLGNFVLILVFRRTIWHS